VASASKPPEPQSTVTISVAPASISSLIARLFGP